MWTGETPRIKEPAPGASEILQQNPKEWIRVCWQQKRFRNPKTHSSWNDVEKKQSKLVREEKKHKAKSETEKRGRERLKELA